MANLGKIVYLSEAQLATLIANGTITVDGKTVVYSENDIYMTPSWANDDAGALSAAMSYVVSGNKSIESVTIPVGAYVRLVGSTITGRSDGIYTVASAIPVNTVIDGTYFNESAPIPGGVANALNASTMLLWTNPSPTTAMDTNTQIVLNSNDYDLYEVIYRTMASASELASVKSVKGSGAFLSTNIYGGHGRSANGRGLVYIDDTHLNADACYGFSRSADYTDNSYCVPVYVIGYKTKVLN